MECGPADGSQGQVEGSRRDPLLQVAGGKRAPLLCRGWADQDVGRAPARHPVGIALFSYPLFERLGAPAGDASEGIVQNLDTRDVGCAGTHGDRHSAADTHEVFSR
jgi:hypothetical protein